MLRSSGWTVLMIVPVAMAGTAWPEGTTGIFSLLNLLLTASVVLMALGGTILWLYRKVRGLPGRPTRGAVLQGNLRASLWLEYLAWSNTGVPTHHTVFEGGQLRMRDLEHQLFDPPDSRPSLLWAIFRCPFFSTTPSSVASNSVPSNSVPSNSLSSSSLSLSSCSSSSRSSTDDNIANRSNTPERPHVPQPRISTADGTGCATTTKDHGKIKTHGSISPAQSAGPSKIPTADKTRESPRPVITPPPKVHRATSSNENKSPKLPAAPSFVFSPSVEDRPPRPPRARSHLRTSSNSYASSKTFPSLGLD